MNRLCLNPALVGLPLWWEGGSMLDGHSAMEKNKAGKGRDG